MFFNSLVNIVGVLCVPFFHFIGRKGIRDYWTLQRIKGNKFDVKYSLFRNMLYPDCNELDPFFIIRTIYQYRYQNPTQYLHFYTNQTYVVLSDASRSHYEHVELLLRDMNTAFKELASLCLDVWMFGCIARAACICTK